MRAFTHKMMLLTAMAIAALAVASAPALAQHDVEVSSEPQPSGANEHCTPSCHLTAQSEEDTVIRFHVSHPTGAEVTQSICTDLFEGFIDEAGEGAVTQATLFGPNCNSFPCTTGSGPGDGSMLPWPFHVREEGGGTEHLSITFCLWGAGNPFVRVPCTITPAIEIEASHVYEITAVDENCAETEAEISGHWDINEFIEIIHLAE